MITFIHGNIFESNAEVITNTVNCVGVMGKGLALQFKNRYPHMFSVYVDVCRKGLLCPGKLMIIAESDHRVMLFPTKDDWRNQSELWMIEDGLDKFVATYKQHSIKSIAFPRLGCGCGGLDWNIVKQLMISKLYSLDCEIFIYERCLACARLMNVKIRHCTERRFDYGKQT